MDHMNKQSREEYYFKLKRISWSAVVTGVLLAIIIQLLLSMLGVGIGLTSFSPTTDSNPFSGYGTGTIIWWFISVLLSLFAGGWVAGWLNNSADKIDNIVHGALTWAIFTLLSLYVVTSSLGNILGGIGKVVEKTFNAAGNVISDISSDATNLVGSQLGIDNEDLKNLKKEATTLLRQSGKKELQPEYLENRLDKAKKEVKKSGKEVAEDPTNLQDEGQSLIKKLIDLQEDILSAADQEALANIVSERTGKSKEEAKMIVRNWAETADQAKQQLQQTAEKAKEEAKRIGDEASSALGKAAILGFFALVLGAITAIVGATIANKKRHEHGNVQI
ncbi:hypothetical protein [Sphingobacterium chungjuense]|uniref:hypothetical protein n=1 Tax=Sphingobacterium chungjuense TaxID=2675553 RepID=UPI0014077D26|nr:hypothetical protein [Sphingobacterium chungjuense]